MVYRAVTWPAMSALPFPTLHAGIEDNVKRHDRGGLFSVALSLSGSLSQSRTVGVTHHRALWSPDFPPWHVPGPKLYGRPVSRPAPELRPRRPGDHRARHELGYHDMGEGSPEQPAFADQAFRHDNAKPNCFESKAASGWEAWPSDFTAAPPRRTHRGVCALPSSSWRRPASGRWAGLGRSVFYGADPLRWQEPRGREAARLRIEGREVTLGSTDTHVQIKEGVRSVKCARPECPFKEQDQRAKRTVPTQPTAPRPAVSKTRKARCRKLPDESDVAAPQPKS